MLTVYLIQYCLCSERLRPEFFYKLRGGGGGGGGGWTKKNKNKNALKMTS